MTRRPRTFPGALLPAVLPALLLAPLLAAPAACGGAGGRGEGPQPVGVGPGGTPATRAGDRSPGDDHPGMDVGVDAGAGSARPVALLPDSGTTVLAAAVVVPGAAWELPATRGLTVLTARALLEGVTPALDSLGARADVACGRAAFTFRLVAPAGSGEAALAVLLDGLFRPRIRGDAVERAREALRATRVLDRASPSWEGHLAGRQALYGDTAASARWAAPACGVVDALERYDTAWVRAGTYRFLPEHATVAAVGFMDPGRTEELLRRRLPPGPRPLLPAPPSVQAGRRYVERNTVTTWLTVAWPFAAGADLEAIRLVGALLEESVAPAVGRPEVLDAGVELLLDGGGGALFLHLVLDPQRVEDYAARLEEGVAAMAREGVPDALLARVRERERGRELLARATPEARAAAVALALARREPPGDGWPSREPVSAARLRAAAGALAAPARAVVGPRPARGVPGAGVAP